jgi:hypothetical protein
LIASHLSLKINIGVTIKHAIDRCALETNSLVCDRSLLEILGGQTGPPAEHISQRRVHGLIVGRWARLRKRSNTDRLNDSGNFISKIP